MQPRRQPKLPIGLKHCRRDANAERWCYLFRNLATFVTVPGDASEFEPIFEIARTGELDPNELKRYLSTMVTEYDKLVIGEYNRELGRKEGLEEGRKEGREEGRKEAVRAMVLEMKQIGIPAEQIVRITHLSEEQINDILN